MKKSIVSFSEKVEAEEIGSPGERKNIDLDKRSREEMEEYPFAKMLEDYVEKERYRFFDYGGVGYKWTKNAHFPSFGSLFKDGLKKNEDGYPIELIPIALGDYPQQVFIDAYKDYLSFQENGPTLNPDVTDFIPFQVETTKLARSCPREILGTTKIGSPKPSGPPPPRRPTTSSRVGPMEKRGPNDIDGKIAELEKRIKRLQNMSHTPLCPVAPL